MPFVNSRVLGFCVFTAYMVYTEVEVIYVLLLQVSELLHLSAYYGCPGLQAMLEHRLCQQLLPAASGVLGTCTILHVKGCSLLTHSLGWVRLPLPGGGCWRDQRGLGERGCHIMLLLVFC